MDKFLIQGRSKLSGQIDASGSKNAALPILFASILSEEDSILRNVPRLQDMESTLKMLLHMGAQVEQNMKQHFSSDWTIRTKELNGHEAPYDLVRKMRASFFCLGPLLGRFGRARVSLPGGCAIGARPVDLHIDALASLGAEQSQEAGYLEFTTKDNGLQGNLFKFKKVSVGATENLMMAATKAQGESIIQNAAAEPEVRYLAEALISMGAKITGHGTDEIKITGVDTLRGLDFTIPSDRIEAGTYMIAAQLTGGDVTIRNCPVEDLDLLIQKLKESGAEVSVEGESIRVVASEKIHAVSIQTDVFPGFPTDLQAQWVALMTQADGVSEVQENIFENRFMHVPELIRMGAKIDVNGSMLKITGNKGNLVGAPVMATDLRASASLVISALVAEGETEVKRIYHLDRGYESMELKLRSLGAKLERVAE